MELFKVSLLITPSTANTEKRLPVLTLLLKELHNALVPNSFDKSCNQFTLES